MDAAALCTLQAVFLGSHVAQEVKLIYHLCQGLAGLPKEKNIWKQAVLKPQKRAFGEGQKGGVGWDSGSRSVWTPEGQAPDYILLLKRKKASQWQIWIPVHLRPYYKTQVDVVLAPNLFRPPISTPLDNPFLGWPELDCRMGENRTQTETWKVHVHWVMLSCCP